MSDYRRWISYIFAYENGVKKKNAGYAKLELKDGKLTMTLHVTPDNREGNYRVCLYKSQSGRKEGVLLGDMEKKQSGEGIRFIENASDLKGSGLLFQEMNGLLLYDDRGKYLISSWEDDPVEIPVMQEIIAMLERRRKDMSVAGKGDGNGEEVEMKANEEGKIGGKVETKVMEKTESGMEITGNAGGRVKEETQENEKKGMGMNAFGNGESRMQKESGENGRIGNERGEMGMKTVRTEGGKIQEENVKNEEREATTKAIEKTERKTRTEDGKREEGKTKIGMENTEKAEMEKETPEPAMGISKHFDMGFRAGSADYSAWVSKAENEHPEENATKMQIKTAEVQTEEKIEQAEMSAMLPENKSQENDTGADIGQQPGKLESRVFSCLPAMYPFEHQEFERSVRMDPQDIGLLPREMWKYAGNSFLLHSYYAYHHILFARKVRKEGRNCYLMLPGTYNPKEQHMAQLFGFSRFCPVRKKALQQGDFGYWYMEVGFPDA